MPMKKTIIILYTVAVAVMATATFVESAQGTAYVSTHIYGAWWFSVLWGLLAAAAIWWFVSRKVRRPSVVALHAAFVIILAGALLTHLTAWQGVMHLRIGETANTYNEQGEGGTTAQMLPFSVRLDTFVVSYHQGTRAARDFTSSITIIDGDEQLPQDVSMNNICSHRSVRFYQNGYDPDGRGTYLALNSDPWGIGVTYTGYALLFLSLIWMLADPKGGFRQLLRHPLLSRIPQKAAITVMLLTMATGARAANTVPEDMAERFGQLSIQYNDRICPIQTFAIDFIKKIHGSRTYDGMKAERVVMSWMFYPDSWDGEKIIRVKDATMRRQLGLEKYVSLHDFFNQEGYILGPYLEEYQNGKHDKLHKACMDMDDKLMLIMQLRQLRTLRIFPFPTDGETVWLSPSEGKWPDGMKQEELGRFYDIMPLMLYATIEGKADEAHAQLKRLADYQKTYGGASLQSPTAYRAERIYNAFPFATVLFMFCLTMGMLSMLWQILSSNDKLRKRRLFSSPRVQGTSAALFALAFAALTCCLVLRWIITGHVPMANGYETMLVMAWMVMLVTLLMQRRIPLMLTFGWLLSGFMLLVSHIGQMDPQISHLMPVLQSPLLSIHVSVIMMAYALLSLTFVIALAWLVMRKEHLVLLSQLFIYPALTLLGIGIFVGAIWANVSWGTYWSWDPKETWALITFMVYAVPVHHRSLQAFKRPAVYQTYMLLAFLTVLMTYFGVNYVLGGMHSYA